MSVVGLARPEIRSLTPYSSARMQASGGEVLLNANESPWPSIVGVSAGLNRYPQPQPAPLLDRLAHLYGVATEQVLIGRGSDEAIDLLVRAFCCAGRDAVLVCPPTFGMYSVCARIQNAGVIEVPLTRTFELAADAVLAAATPQTKIVFVCSPNNPTGGIVPLSAIALLAKALSGRALVVVDEAYIEFAGVTSAISLLARLPNLAVLRTLSKAYALAGARIGALVAAPDVVALLRRIQAPYPLPTPCVNAALDALTAEALNAAGARVDAIVGARERLAPLLASLAQVREVLPSAANFLCVRCGDAKAIQTMLLQRGIVVRDVSSQPGLDGCVRISIGTPQENQRLLTALGACEVVA